MDDVLRKKVIETIDAALRAMDEYVVEDTSRGWSVETADGIEVVYVEVP